jgi:3-hydroxyacyl-CoA dehydrogenase
MGRPIQSVAILGAGTMGAQIAAHFANAGVSVLLLDLTDQIAGEGLKRARQLKPDPFFSADVDAWIKTGGFDGDLARVGDVDWIIEAVIEQIELKQSLLARVDAVRRPGTIITSNTSGIPISVLATGRSDDFRHHWLGTHFFNPPRYLRLLEIIPTADTDPEVIERVSIFADVRLGKGVVVAKDAPNFIANHIGLFGMIQVLRALESGDYTIEEIDAMTGPAIGRPKSATFRTADIAGIDVLGHVARNLAASLPDDEARAVFRLPPLVDALIDRGWIGEKTGQGFYKRGRAPGTAGNETEILTLDPASLAYRAKRPVMLPALDAVRSIDDAGMRLKTLFLGQDKVGSFLRHTLGPTLLYTARVAPSIANSIDDVDRAMQWGFGWELGPFESMDAIGIREVVDSVNAVEPLTPLIGDVLRAGRNRFREGRVPPAGPKLQILRSAKDRQRIVRRNSGASLVDLGDGVLALEFHSKMNAIGADAIAMMQTGIREAVTSFQALVIGNDAPNFSAGANLMLLLIEAQEGNWDEIDLMVRTFQAATSGLRYADVPVVSCPAGLTLGGGCEIVLHTDRVQAAAESYIGLVEAGVGLIPAGGGTKEMLARAVEGLASPATDLLPAVQAVFETIGFAKVSTSAEDARRLRYLRPVDCSTMNRERLMADGKALALERVREGYHKPAARQAITVGGEGVLAALKLGVHLAWRAGRISDHDALIGRVLAGILAGGALPHQTVVSEQYLLDLEREAFLKLCGERKTLERIQHTLKTGKPLRN